MLPILRTRTSLSRPTRIALFTKTKFPSPSRWQKFSHTGSNFLSPRYHYRLIDWGAVTISHETTYVFLTITCYISCYHYSRRTSNHKKQKGNNLWCSFSWGWWCEFAPEYNKKDSWNSRFTLNTIPMKAALTEVHRRTALWPPMPLKETTLCLSINHHFRILTCNSLHLSTSMFLVYL